LDNNYNKCIAESIYQNLLWFFEKEMQDYSYTNKETIYEQLFKILKLEYKNNNCHNDKLIETTPKIFEQKYELNNNNYFSNNQILITNLKGSNGIGVLKVPNQ